MRLILVGDLWGAEASWSGAIIGARFTSLLLYRPSGYRELNISWNLVRNYFNFVFREILASSFSMNCEEQSFGETVDAVTESGETTQQRPLALRTNHSQ